MLHCIMSNFQRNNKLDDEVVKWRRDETETKTKKKLNQTSFNILVCCNWIYTMKNWKWFINEKCSINETAEEMLHIVSKAGQRSIKWFLSVLLLAVVGCCCSINFFETCFSWKKNNSIIGLNEKPQFLVWIASTSVMRTFLPSFYQHR